MGSILSSNILLLLIGREDSWLVLVDSWYLESLGILQEYVGECKELSIELTVPVQQVVMVVQSSVFILVNNH